MRFFVAFALALAALTLSADATHAQAATDSTLVRRILQAEAERDVSSAALVEGTNSADPRIQLLARRAMARIGDPKFASRDSFPALPAPPGQTIHSIKSARTPIVHFARSIELLANKLWRSRPSRNAAPASA